MKEKFIELEGKDYNELVKEGLKRLNLKEEDVKVDVIQDRKSVLGFSIKNYKIRIYPRPKIEGIDEVEELEDLITDDHFEINFKDDGVFLTVYSGTDGYDVKTDDVFRIIEEKLIKEYDIEGVKEATRAKSGKPVKIAPAQPENIINERVEVTTSSDNMEGFMMLYPPRGGSLLTEDEILESIKNTIKYGLDENKVKSAIKQRCYYNKVLIASGLNPINGNDAFIKHEFNNDKSLKPEVLADGKVDFRNLDIISNVQKNQTLSVKSPSTEGQPGYDVYGRLIPQIKGKDCSFKYGKNIILSEDGLKLISSIDGQACLEGDKVTVHETYEVPANVDNSTGNISFNGSVRVRGSVLTGFEVKARGDIEVEGVVEGALIESEGSIILKRGIQGYNKGRLVSKGNIIAKYIENSNISSESIIHAETIMHSEVSSKDKIQVVGKKGLIVGGICKATKEIRAKTIGSTMATSTILEVGADPGLRAKLEEVKKIKRDIEENIEKIDKGITLLGRLAKNNNLPEDKKELLNKYILTRKVLIKQLQEKSNEIIELEENIEFLSNGKIIVEDTVYPGVKIIIGNSVMFVRDEIKHCTIYRESGEIKIGTYEK